MYCGDETGSFVGDIGSHVARFGYGGEDCPKYVVPSRVAYSDASKSQSKTSIPHIPHTCYSEWTDVRLPMTPPAVADYRSPLVDPAAYLSQGDSVHDWDAYEHVWQSALDALHVRHPAKHRSRPVRASGKMAVAPKNHPPAETAPLDQPVMHPLLIVSPGCSATAFHDNDNNNNKSQQSRRRREMERLVELAMESFQCPALFVAPSPMLAAFSVGRATATIVDVGAGGCRVTPVVDGLVLGRAQRRNGRGGDWLDNVVWHQISSTGQTKIVPRYQLRGGVDNNTHRLSHPQQPRGGIFHRWAVQDVCFEFRTGPHMVPTRPDESYVPFTGGARPMSTDETKNTGTSTSHYELPDGTHLDLTTAMGQDLCHVHELLFAKQHPFAGNPTSTSAATTTSSTITTTNFNNNKLHSTFLPDAPLHQLVWESLAAVGDVQARKDLCGSLILTGGASVIPCLEQRLAANLPMASAFKTRVVASKFAVERSYAAWIGGSIVSSLGSFQQLWLSPAEYEEYGATLALQRFP